MSPCEDVIKVVYDPERRLDGDDQISMSRSTLRSFAVIPAILPHRHARSRSADIPECCFGVDTGLPNETDGFVDREVHLRAKLNLLHHDCPSDESGQANERYD